MRDISNQLKQAILLEKIADAVTIIQAHPSVTIAFIDGTVPVAHFAIQHLADSEHITAFFHALTQASPTWVLDLNYGDRHQTIILYRLLTLIQACEATTPVAADKDSEDKNSTPTKQKSPKQDKLIECFRMLCEANVNIHRVSGTSIDIGTAFPDAVYALEQFESKHPLSPAVATLKNIIEQTNKRMEQPEDYYRLDTTKYPNSDRYAPLTPHPYIEQIGDIALDAVRYVKSELTLGSENNLREVERSATVTVWLGYLTTSPQSKLAYREMKAEGKESNASTTLEVIIKQAELARKYKVGDCFYHSALAYEYLATILPLEQLHHLHLEIDHSNHRHRFVIIALNDQFQVSDLTTWDNNAIICDPWCNAVYPAQLRQFQERGYFTMPGITIRELFTPDEYKKAKFPSRQPSACTTSGFFAGKHSSPAAASDTTMTKSMLAGRHLSLNVPPPN